MYTNAIVVDRLDAAITSALELLPGKQRQRPAINDVLNHAARWTRLVTLDPTAAAARVVAAETVTDFDTALAEALDAANRANAITGGPGHAFAQALDHGLETRHLAALRAEADALAEKLRPVVSDAEAQLIAAASELPSGSEAVDPTAVLAAGAGDAWRRAHNALATLTVAAGVCRRPTIGEGPTGIHPDRQHLAPVVAMIDIADVGSRTHDVRGVDITTVIDAGQATAIATVQRFAHDTRTSSTNDVLLNIAQGRWSNVTLGYDPSGGSATRALHLANTSRMVTTDQAHAHATKRKAGAHVS